MAADVEVGKAEETFQAGDEGTKDIEEGIVHVETHGYQDGEADETALEDSDHYVEHDHVDEDCIAPDGHYDHLGPWGDSLNHCMGADGLESYTHAVEITEGDKVSYQGMKGFITHDVGNHDEYINIRYADNETKVQEKIPMERWEDIKTSRHHLSCGAFFFSPFSDEEGGELLQGTKSARQYRDATKDTIQNCIVVVGLITVFSLGGLNSAAGVTFSEESVWPEDLKEFAVLLQSSTLAAAFIFGAFSLIMTTQYITWIQHVPCEVFFQFADEVGDSILHMPVIWMSITVMVFLTSSILTVSITMPVMTAYISISLTIVAGILWKLNGNYFNAAKYFWMRKHFWATRENGKNKFNKYLTQLKMSDLAEIRKHYEHESHKKGH